MIHVLSLGAGVQSSTLALLAAHGEVTPMPDAAVFADTQAEPGWVYEQLDWLKSRLPFPIYQVTAGNLRRQLLDASAGRAVRFDARPPFYVGPTKAGGVLRRQCTQDYKIRPIQRQIAVLAGVKPRNRGPREPSVTQWIGISLDELVRMKPSGRRWITNRWPLIERRMTRWHCERWLWQHGYPVPKKSACTFCPYHDNATWRLLRDESPPDWQDAVAMDRAIRSMWARTKLHGEVFVHPDRVPLDQVDLSTPEDHGQLTMFEEECAGMCGV